MMTLWALGLFAVLGLGYWIRKSMHASSGKKVSESERRIAAKQLLDQDRLDCLELERAVTGSPVGGREPKPAKPAPVSYN